MGFNRENYKRVKEEYDGKYRRAEDAAMERRAEVHLAVEGVAEVDKYLSAIGMRIFEATLKGDKAELDAIAAEHKRLIAKRADLLISAGYAPDYTDIKYECAECGDTGVIDNRMCSCMRKKLVEAGFVSSGMYELIKKQNFDNFNIEYYGQHKEFMSKVVEKIRRYADNFDPATSGNLALFGKTGLGKTHLCSAMAAVIIEKGYDVYYTSAMNMFADFEIKRFGNSTSYEAGGDIDKYYTCDLLMIDDLGTEVHNQFTTSCLYNVIDSRLNRSKPTVINTNLTQEELRKIYWDRITSRILGEYKIMPFVGVDVRSQKLK